MRQPAMCLSHHPRGEELPINHLKAAVSSPSPHAPRSSRSLPLPHPRHRADGRIPDVEHGADERSKNTEHTLRAAQEKQHPPHRRDASRHT
jgi:hypothetical protein